MPERKVNLGKALELPEAEDPEEAEPDERDIQQADERANLTVLLAAIWGGVVIWDRLKLRYRTHDGKVVSDKSVKRAFEKIVVDSQLRLRALSQSLLDRQISIAAWQMAVRDELKIVHYIAGATAQGGPSHLSPIALRRIGELTQPQYTFLNKFARQVETGVQALNGQVLQRSALYGGAARATFYETQVTEATARGAQVAERIRNVDESCPGCVETEGFWPIDEVPPIGSQECLNNCKCTVEFLDELPEGEKFNDSEAFGIAASEIVRRQLELRQPIK